MVKAGVNWDAPETWQRLVASMLASGMKPDLKSVALHFGTTYDTLENRFRKIKKDAAGLKEEIDTGARGEVAPTRKSASSTPRKPRSPKSSTALEVVANGRVTKSTPSKKSAAAIKQEQFDADLNSFLTEAFDDTPIGFDLGSYENSFVHSSMLDVDDSF